MFKEKRLRIGDCIDHMLSWWNYRNHPRVLVVTYEDMQKDAKGNIHKVGKFLGSPSYSDDELEKIADEASFNKMKSRPIKKTFQTAFVKSSDIFFRKGKVGSWKDLFEAEQEDYVDKRVQSEMNSVGITFD